jgi:flagellar basal-body rod modification protein FlgD
MSIPSINPELEALGLSRDLQPEKKQELGADAFLKLMITQFRNQDPFKPLDSGEFLGQLAQFGTVSGLTELKTEFQSLSGSLVSNQALQASALLGREVLVNRPTGWLPAEGGGIAGAVDLPSAAQQVRVQVLTDGGAVVRTFDLGPQGAGLARFSWDGLADDGTALPEGAYTFSAQSISGAYQVAVQALVAAPVESVTLGAGQGGLSLSLRGLGDIPFGDVRQIG